MLLTGSLLLSKIICIVAWNSEGKHSSPARNLINDDIVIMKCYNTCMVNKNRKQNMSEIFVKNHNPLKFKNVSKDCIYFMEDCKGEVIYIGRSKKYKINARMRSHELTSHFFEEVFKIYILCLDSYVDMCMHEILYINKIKPKYNKELYEGDHHFTINTKNNKILYYNKGEVARVYKDRKCDYERKSNSDRLQERKEKYEGLQTTAGTILEVFKDKSYKCKFVCGLCGNIGESSLKNLLNDYTKSCGCLNNLSHKSPYYKEYENINKDLGMEISEIKLWRKRYADLARKYRRLNGYDIPLSLKEYIKKCNRYGFTDRLYR